MRFCVLYVYATAHYEVPEFYVQSYLIYLNYSPLFFIKIVLFSLSDQLFDKANHSFAIFTCYCRYDG